jgi:Rrf2 family protein
MKLQTSTRLAIFALLELAADAHRQLSVAAIGEKYDVSSHHLAKVMKELAHAGFVRAVRGAGGGYQFVGNARRLTLLDVIQHFEDLSSADGGDIATGAMPEVQAFAEVLGEVDDIARATFGSITIATMQKIVERHRDSVKTREAALRSTSMHEVL